MASRRLLVLVVILPAFLSAWPPPSARAQPPGGKRKVSKTDAEWEKLLTPSQFMVTRKAATEPAFSGRYVTNHARGTYACVCCGAPLFSSQAKFDSGTGWPSFSRPVDPKRIETATDNHLAEPRIEVLCKDCGAHLGHVFDDGPPPTGLRYCINSLALKFAPATAAPKTSARARGKAKAKPKPASRGDATADPKVEADGSATPGR